MTRRPPAQQRPPAASAARVRISAPERGRGRPDDAPGAHPPGTRVVRRPRGGAADARARPAAADRLPPYAEVVVASASVTMPTQDAPATFADRVVAWQRRAGRHDLPWQGTRDPYRIWLSEIMLQQTQVGTVLPYYRRFLARFASIDALAAASVDEVLALWSGLGYYSRARNLHRAAVAVVTTHGGRFPRGLAEVQALPGVGRSTAAAICAFAWGERHAILDGNVKRLLARHAGIQGWPGESAVQAALWREAQARLPADGIEAYTQGLMDLGAGPCARRPRCDRCPVAQDCAARMTGQVDRIPAPRPRRDRPRRTTEAWIVLDGERVLLERRPPRGIWGGLWSLPETRPSQADGCEARSLASLAHAFTHFDLEIQPRLVRLDPGGHGARPGLQAEGWHRLDTLERLGLPAPVRALLASLPR
jgi:A/G-specific adenine glycosylase